MKYIFFLVCSFFFSNFCLSSSTFCPEASKNIGEEIFREKEEIYLAHLASVAVMDNPELVDQPASDLGSEKTYKELIGKVYPLSLLGGDPRSFIPGTVGEFFVRSLVQLPTDGSRVNAASRFAKENGIGIMEVDDFIVNKLREDYKFRKAIYDAGERIKWRKRYEANKPTPEALREDFLRRKKAEEHKEVMNIFKTAGVWAAYVGGILLICYLLYALGRSMSRGWSFTRWACFTVILLLGTAVAAGHEWDRDGDDFLWFNYTLPYGYYTFLRLSVAALGAWLVYRAWKRKAKPLFVILPAFLVILYQPFEKIPLKADLWCWVNMASIPVLAVLAIPETEKREAQHSSS